MDPWAIRLNHSLLAMMTQIHEENVGVWFTHETDPEIPYFEYTAVAPQINVNFGGAKGKKGLLRSLNELSVEGTLEQRGESMCGKGKSIMCVAWTLRSVRQFGQCLAVVAKSFSNGGRITPTPEEQAEAFIEMREDELRDRIASLPLWKQVHLKAHLKGKSNAERDGTRREVAQKAMLEAISAREHASMFAVMTPEEQDLMLAIMSPDQQEAMRAIEFPKPVPWGLQVAGLDSFCMYISNFSPSCGVFNRTGLLCDSTCLQ